MSRKFCCNFNLWLIRGLSQRLPAIATQNRERGFALPTALMFGLVILMAVSSLLIRSSDDRVTATMQQQADASLNIADGGISRVQAFIAANALLAQYNLGDWSAQVASLVSLSSSCSARTLTQTEITNFISNSMTWQNIDSADASRGQFRLASYTYTSNNSSLPNTPPGRGVLEIEGRTPSHKSINRIRVTIPVLAGDVEGVPVPGLWLAEGGTGNNTIQGSVLLNDCSVSPSSISVTGNDPFTEQPYRAMATNLRMPDPPPRPNHIPNSLPSSRINDNITLPRASDVPTPKTIRGQAVEVYEYRVDSLDIANNKTLTITPGTRVTFYLSGNIERGGDIEHNCGSNPNCHPTNFQIFGYGAVGNSICVNGITYIDAFILAPNYEVGVAGSGGGQGGFRGAVWTRDWSNSGGCGSNTSNIVFRQTANWEMIEGIVPQNLPPKLAPISNWERVDRAL
ncbi:DUF7305 domain-containing protein [Leptolyngbya ohadii]|uniref:DUF7305 domain-containing protein n=1 Tax=Leptolyngbya ohadii TaxID=1962290 RepID=UPI000B59E588|nr:hypothetical protein [Leptolyngbya ohadii]